MSMGMIRPAFYAEPVPYVSLVIPAYDEERRILSTLEKIQEYCNGKDYSFETIIVDDGSSDRTTEDDSSTIR